MGSASHIIIVDEHSAQDAINAVESHIEGWGTENNWSSVYGAFSKDGTERAEGDANLDAEDSLEGWQKMAKDWIKDSIEPSPKELEEIQKCVLFPEDCDNTITFGRVVEWAEGMREKVFRKTNLETFDIFKDEFFPYQFDKEGVTNIESGNNGEGSKQYAVMINMHI